MKEKEREKWHDKGCEEEKLKVAGRLPGKQSSGRTDGWGKAVLGAPSLCWSGAKKGYLPQLTFSQGTLHYSAGIIVSIAAALRRKYKRATWRQLHQWHQWHGKVRVTEGQRKRNLTNIKGYQLQKEKDRSEEKVKALRVIFSKDKILSSKGIESRVWKRYLYLMVTEHSSQQPRGQGTQVSMDGWMHKPNAVYT